MRLWRRRDVDADPARARRENIERMLKVNEEQEEIARRLLVMEEEDAALGLGWRVSE